MPTPVKDPKSLNPADADYEGRFNNIARAEQLAGINTSFNLPTISDGDRNTNPLSALKNTEQNTGGWNTNIPTSPVSLALQGIKAKNKGLTKGLIGGGVSIIGIALILLVAIIPMKLQGMLSNIMTAASEVPQHAVEKRVEYLVTRALASRMLAMSEGVDAQLIFCKSGGIGCSLIKTYTNDYFEKKLGITLDVDTQGRTSLGGKAKQWSIAVDTKNTSSDVFIKPGTLNGTLNFDETEIEKARKLISSNSQMKAVIKTEVNSKTRWYNINRYIARKLLMEKYGVRMFSGPKKVEDTVNKISSARSTMKARIIKNTAGKITPRAAMYLTCLSDQDACQKLREGIKKDLESTNPKNKEGWDTLPADQQARELAEYETKVVITEAIEESTEEILKGEAEGKLSKLLSQTVIKSLGTATAVIGISDLIWKAVDAVDDGALEAISYDINSQGYTGFSTEIGTVVGKVVAGDLDLETLQATTELFNNAEQSPLYQAETSPTQYYERAASSSTGPVVDCKGTSSDTEKTTLPKGELICPEQRVVRDYTTQLTQNPVWSKFADVAHFYNDYWTGKAIKWFNDGVSDLIGSIPGYDKVVDTAMNVAGGPIQGALNWFIELAFGIPNVGPDATGIENYVAASGGTRITQNAIMEYGVDSDGKASGAGGKILSDTQIAAIHNEAEAGRQTEFASKSLAERMFDTSLSKSFASQLIARIPTSFSSLVTLPKTSLLSVLSTSSVNAATTSGVTLNPFHLPIYGYDPNDTSVFEANPDTYTPEYCAASAAKREASYERRDGDVLPVYHESDPCALEKIVIGSELAEQGIEGDEYSFQSIQDIAIPNNTTTTPVTQTPAVVGDITQDSSNVACASGTEDQGVSDGYKSGKRIKIRLCAIPGTYSRSSEDAKYGRKIVVNSRVSGPAIAMINKMKSDLGMATANFTSSFRTNSVQSSLYSAYINGTGNVASRPGFSNHQLGTAFDVDFGGGISNKSAYCKSATIANICRPPKASAIYDWLNANAKKYGFSQYYKEYWHWEYK